MRSLFARIWASYLLVMALTLAAALTVSFALAVRRAETVNRLSPNSFVASARAALASDGTDGLRRWIVELRHGHPELQMYFLDSSAHELESRSIAGKPLPGSTGAVTPRLVAPNGAVFRMVVRQTRKFAFSPGDLFLNPGVLLAIWIVVSGLGCAWLARYLTHPIVQLRTGVRTIASGNLEGRLDRTLVERRDELGTLAQDFDAMVASLRALIASKVELLRDVSHELRSPLARLRVAAGLARTSSPTADAAAFDRIDREVERLDGMIEQILHFSRLGAGPSPDFQDIDLVELLQETVEDARIEATEARQDLELDVPERLAIHGDSAKLRSAMENVLRNAIHFAPPGSPIRVRLSAGEGAARILVEDSGPGIAEPDTRRVFEPFVRGDRSKGAGLGLAIAERILALHGGSINAANRAEGGLCVEMRLPLERGGIPDGNTLQCGR